MRLNEKDPEYFKIAQREKDRLELVKILQERKAREVEVLIPILHRKLYPEKYTK